MKYRLIQLNPLQFSNKFDGYPAVRTKGDPDAFVAPNGYKYVEELDLPTEAPSAGKKWVRDLTTEAFGWKQEDIVEVAVVREVTKLVLMRRLVTINKWQTFEALLGTLEPLAKTAWDLALSVREDDELVVENKEAIKQALSLDEASFLALLDPEDS